MAVLTTAKRKRLRDSSFAYPERRLLPIHDANHVRVALGARFRETIFDSVGAMKRAARRIIKAAKRHKIDVDPTGYVARIAGEGLSGQRKVKRRTNPSKADPELQAAKRMSDQFHGTSQIIELSEKERRLPRYVVSLGAIPRLEYEPSPSSKRGQYRYVHESGSRGPLASKSKKRPILAVDPRTRRPVIVPMGSPMKLDPRRGLIG